MKTRPPIYTRYYDLLGWLLDHTAKFPKHMRFGLVQKIEGVALDLLDQLTEALFRADRHLLHDAVNIRIEKLRVFLRLSHDRQLLSADQLRFAIGELDEVGRMWHGWTGDRKKASRAVSPSNTVETGS